MLFRSLLMLIAAAVLFALPPMARACPAHDAAGQATVLHQNTQPTLCLASERHCTAQSAASRCGSFHLCCVTPPGMPATVLETMHPRTAGERICSRLKSGTPVVLLSDDPPPRS